MKNTNIIHHNFRRHIDPPTRRHGPSSERERVRQEHIRNIGRVARFMKNKKTEESEA